MDEPTQDRVVGALAEALSLTWAVPLTDVQMAEEDLAAVAECLRSGWLTMGPRTAAFEAAVAEWTGSPYAVAVSSGTAALHLALRGAGTRAGRRGDRAGVHVPGHRACAALRGARVPVLADVVSLRGAATSIRGRRRARGSRRAPAR